MMTGYPEPLVATRQRAADSSDTFIMLGRRKDNEVCVVIGNVRKS